MKKTLLISGFPAVGKTHFQSSSKLKVLDSDSSKFDKNYFPDNYIKHIKNNMGLVDIILISSHDLVREALINEGLKFVLVYPNIELKDEYIDRYIKRGSPNGFIDLVSSNWNDWILQLKNQDGCLKFELNTEQYLGEVVNELMEKQNDMKNRIPRKLKKKLKTQGLYSDGVSMYHCFACQKRINGYGYNMYLCEKCYKN